MELTKSETNSAALREFMELMKSDTELIKSDTELIKSDTALIKSDTAEGLNLLKAVDGAKFKVKGKTMAKLSLDLEDQEA